MTKLRNWEVAVLIVLYCSLYNHKLVFLSMAADAVNHTTADERGFVNIDCGNEGDTVPPNYQSDAAFIDVGRSFKILPQYLSAGLDSIYKTGRSFPNRNRSCYHLQLSKGRNYNYLIRALFMYGNYDRLNSLPSFDIYVGVDFGNTVSIESANEKLLHEFIYKPRMDFIYFCLINTAEGTPFISALELRPLKNSIYNSDLGALQLMGNRYATGFFASDNATGYKSYADDTYDRYWSNVPPRQFTQWRPYKSSTELESISNDAYEVPPSILRAGVMPQPAQHSLPLSITPRDGTKQLCFYWHFVEMEKLGKNESREFDIFIDGNRLGTFKLEYMKALTVVSPPLTLEPGSSLLRFSINQANTSTHPPILNALEIYNIMITNISQATTNQDDVKAISKIKTTYDTVIRGWQGDPCLPVPPWDGLNCNNTHSDHPRITSLDLSSKGLTGEILPSLSGLTALNFLNLSYNALTGSIPEFLAEMSSLKVIDLRGNKLNGSVPVKLTDRIAQGTLSLSLEDNPDLCVSDDSCKKKKKNWKKIGVIICAAAASVIFIAAAIGVSYKYKHRARNIMHTSEKMESRRFRYSEVMDMTNNCANIMGKGGSGTVYHGLLKDGTSVAVKILNPSSKLSLKLFHTEAELLTRVHHRNLVSLIGYCEKGTTLALIYEHVANGNLQQHISEKTAKVLSWKERLQIAIDAALGLEYLHSGCKPSIVHRDMKTSNILLDENLRAKISDFGISKAFSTESTESSLTTNVVGTHGYLDPEYYSTLRLNKKSDVYSFGVVLLELITGQPPIIRGSSEPIHVIAWTAPKLESGDIDNIVDKRLRGNFSISSAWKALEVAMVCVSTVGTQRPNMNQVLIDLNDSLTIEIEHERTREMENHSTLNVDDDIAAVDTSMEMGPSAR